MKTDDTTTTIPERATFKDKKDKVGQALKSNKLGPTNRAKLSKRKAKPARLTKAGAKRAAKEQARERTAKATAAGRFADDMVITVHTLENPRRPDTQQYIEYELIKRYRGKTVAAYYKAGGKSVFLRYAEAQKHVTVE